MSTKQPGKAAGGGTDSTLTYGGITTNADGTKPPEISIIKKDARWAPTGVGNYIKIDYPQIKTNPNKPFKFNKAWTTNAYIVNHTPGVSSDDDEQRRARLWVKDLTIGWSMEYKEAQGVFGKSFYPRHIKYNDAVITAQTASQDHYDQLVELATEYHKDSIHGSASIIRFEMPAVSYYLADGHWEKGTGNGNQIVRYYYPRLFFDGYLLAVSAGHRKGVYNPEISLRFNVLAYGNEALDMVINTPGKGDPPENIALFKKYKSSFSTGKYTSVTASDPLSEYGYNIIPGGPSGNSGYGGE